MPQESAQAGLVRIVRLLYPHFSSSFPLALIALAALGILVACGGASGPEPAPPTSTGADEEPVPTSAPTTIDGPARDWNVLGSPEAPVTVLDYSDFQ